ncbi:MAG: beta-glucosidase [Gemmatimonadales bacterium]|nr:beta-glucosidase [Gemmatimonadales bacterium]
MSSPFRSFWMGGFESACHINGAGQRLDMICATQHDVRADEDYALLRSVGIRTAREGLRWHLIDRGRGQYDFSSARPVVDAAERRGIQVVWNLCHYGWPDDVNLFEPAFIRRFARYAAATARLVRDSSDDVPIYSPINEISFFAWAAGEVGYIYPHVHGAGGRVKQQLVRAAIEGMDAIRAVDERARFVHADPLIHVLAPYGRPDLARAAADYREAQFEAWDMLAGGMHPELGGHPRYLDIVGANFYSGNQWVIGGERLHWDVRPQHPRWRPLSAQLQDLHERYGRPIIVAETSHFGSGRAAWLHDVAGEVSRTLELGVAIDGVCLYPIIDRPDWDDPNHWHNSGLWGLVPDHEGRLRRVLCDEYAAALRQHVQPDERTLYASSATASASAAGVSAASAT